MILWTFLGDDNFDHKRLKYCIVLHRYVRARSMRLSYVSLVAATSMARQWRSRKKKRKSAAVNCGKWNRSRIKLICLMHGERDLRQHACFCWKWPACINFVHSSMMKMWTLYCNDDSTLSFDALASSICWHFTLYSVHCGTVRNTNLFSQKLTLANSCFCRWQQIASIQQYRERHPFGIEYRVHNTH